MQSHRAASAWLLLALVAAPSAAQVTVPAGTVVNLGGAMLNVSCADVSVAGTLATGTGQLAGARDVVVAGGGTLDGGSGVVALSRNFTQSGTFVAGTGTVQVGDGCAADDQHVYRHGRFYGFSTTTATGHSLMFPAGQTQTVAHALALTGAAGALVTIRSSSAGTAGNLALALSATQTIGYVDVADNHATVQPIGPGSAATFHSVKGSNSDGWFQVSASPPVFQSAVSRKTHSAAGTFDLSLSTVLPPAINHNPTTEPRQGPAQTIVFTFDKPLNAATVTITEGAATAAAPTFTGNSVVVALTGVTNQQYVTVSLGNVASTDGGTGGSATVRIGFLVGDVNQNRVVTVADLGLVNATTLATGDRGELSKGRERDRYAYRGRQGDRQRQSDQGTSGTVTRSPAGRGRRRAPEGHRLPPRRRVVRPASAGGRHISPRRSSRCSRSRWRDRSVRALSS